MTKDEIVQKLTSRKFWLCAAAFLGSIATSVAGIATDNHLCRGRAGRGRRATQCGRRA